MQLGYSKTSDAFFFLDEEESYRQNGYWPEDIIPVNDIVWCEFVSEPPCGKIRGGDDDGNPCWVDLPPLSKDEKLKNHLILREEKLNEALEEIRKLEIISGITNLTSSDNTTLNKWKSYLKEIYNVNSQNTDFTWPVKPENDY